MMGERNDWPPLRRWAGTLISLLMVGSLGSCGGATGPVEYPIPEPADVVLPMQNTLQSNLPSTPPIIRGFAVTDEVGNVLGRWGVPNDRGTYAIWLDPKATAIRIPVMLTRETVLVVWVERAYIASDDVPDGLSQFGGATTPEPRREVIRVVQNSQAMAGLQAVTWDLRDDEGHRVPDGPYRTYVFAEGLGYGYTDILFGNFLARPGRR